MPVSLIARPLIGVAFLTASLSLVHVPDAHASGTGKILIVGDSITQGSSGDYTWRYRLWKYLQSADPQWSLTGTRSDLYDNVNSAAGSQYYATAFAGKGHSAKWGGSFVNEGPDITAEVTSTQPDVLVELYGSNDLSFLTSPAQTIANLRTLITRAREARPGIDVVIGQVLTKWDPWSNTTLLQNEAASYNSQLSGLATELNTASQRVVVAPTASGWDPTTQTWDGTHPNSTGETLIAQRVAQALNELGIGVSNPGIFTNVGWGVAGPPVTTTSGVEQATTSWNRTSTGATGMYLEQRYANNAGVWQTWNRLPYAISGQDNWTSTGLVPAANYEFRVVPSKGFMTGIPGPAASAFVSAKPIGQVGNVDASISGPNEISAAWSPATNASGYVLAQRRLQNAGSLWQELPYPVSVTNFKFKLLSSGYHYDFRITPNRGYAVGIPRVSGSVRTPGISTERVYAALGDSYSSGLGSSNTPLETGGPCYRSSNAWATLMQTDWNSATRVIACAGAVTTDITGSQIPTTTAYFSDNNGTGPQLITMTIGGNDVGFSDTIRRCVTGACVGEEPAIAAAIDALQPTLVNLYSILRNDYPAADIVVGGYPGVLDPGGNSINAACLGIGDDEREMANRLAARLNSIIASAASMAGVWSVGSRVYDAFEPGHNACALNGQWINPALDINLITGDASPMSLHPNDAGQTAFSIAFGETFTANATVQ